MPIHRAVIALLLLAVATGAAADEWIPYIDGRVGGCYRDNAGVMNRCTPQPTAAAFPEDEKDEAAKAPEDATQAELREVKRELEAIKQRQAAEDARRASEDAERVAIERAAKAEEQRDIDAAMAAYNAIEAAMEGERRKALERKTEACRGSIEAKGYRIMAPGACRAPGGTYVNCPDC